LHGAYPVLLLLLLRREVNRLVLPAFALYGIMMWCATVVLNQHYIVDLMAGAALAIAAWWVERRFEKRAA
jgi:membrane-associated phospholipid phosphatase